MHSKPLIFQGFPLVFWVTIQHEMKDQNQHWLLAFVSVQQSTKIGLSLQRHYIGCRCQGTEGLQGWLLWETVRGCSVLGTDSSIQRKEWQRGMDMDRPKSLFPCTAWWVEIGSGAVKSSMEKGGGWGGGEGVGVCGNCCFNVSHFVSHYFNF